MFIGQSYMHREQNCTTFRQTPDFVKVICCLFFKILPQILPPMFILGKGRKLKNTFVKLFRNFFFLRDQ